MMWPPPAPITRARSTNERSLTDRTWLRMTRAVDAQLVMPMTMTMTISVTRIPAISASRPTISRMIGARTRARTKVGRTRKRSVMRIRTWSVRPPTNPDTIPTRAPSTTVMIVASRPMTIEIRVPQTVRLRTLRPSASVPIGNSRLGGSRWAPGAVVTVWSGPTKSAGAIARIENTMRTTTPATPGRRLENLPQNSRADRSAHVRPAARRGRSSPVALMPGPADRARRTGSPPRRWRRRP